MYLNTSFLYEFIYNEVQNKLECDIFTKLPQHTLVSAVMANLRHCFYK